MKYFIAVVCLVLQICCTNVIHCQNVQFDLARNSIIQTEEYISTGGNLQLSPKELRVDKILLKHKNAELLDGYNNPDKLAAGMHFFNAKPYIDKSKVFKFLQQMPKGGLLHGHNTAMVSSEWIVKNLTYFPNLLKCINRNGSIVLTFKKYDYHDCATEYVVVADERQRAKNSQFYDSLLEKSINLYTPRPDVEYPNIDVVWKKFQNIFTTIGDMISYLPAFRAFHYRLLEEMYQDGITYIELRFSCSQGYDDYGSIASTQMVQELIHITENFKSTHPNFVGMKVIFTTARRLTAEKLTEKIRLFLDLRSQFPDFICGFDLVGQEDLGNSLYFFKEILEAMPSGVKFFFHAGETNWYGAAADYNMLDALLLNTTRIGHAYALVKHPVLWNSVKQRDIAIEVSPLSNQVLHLVRDLRNHPAAFYISENIPMVISNDDPGFWNAKGVSYDYYYALMSFGSNRSGVRLLKKLILNSLKYTLMTPEERYRSTIVFQKQWDEFMNYILQKGL